jgi:hypothetical protein
MCHPPDVVSASTNLSLADNAKKDLPANETFHKLAEMRWFLQEMKLPTILTDCQE